MSKQAGRDRVRIASSRELFTVMNDHWKLSEVSPDLYEVVGRDNPGRIGPMSADKLVGVLAVISELERHLREGR